MLGAKRQDGTPYYPQTHFYKLPKDLLFLILQYAALPNTEQLKKQRKLPSLKTNNTTPPTRSENEKRLEGD
jgi:hypothetical protein